MCEDVELLQRYAVERSETAFADLIRRHVDLVYSAALRLAAGDTHRAEDITQQVFAELARQAPKLLGHPALAGWLYTTTRLMSLRAGRTERRRAAREQEAYRMNELLRETAPGQDWTQLRPVLDEAMHELCEPDRLAVLLRYFQDKSLREVGLALGLSENAARMRVERAVDRLRAQLARRGITSTASALAILLTAHAITAAPTPFVATLPALALTGTAATAGATASLLKLLSAHKLATALAGAAIIAAVATPAVLQHQSQTTLQTENHRLRGEVDRLAPFLAENTRLSNQLAQVSREPVASPAVAETPSEEVLQLRAEITRLRNDSLELARLKAAPRTSTVMDTSVERVKRLKEQFAQMPDRKIPEMELLTEGDWAVAASALNRLNTPDDFRAGLALVRRQAKIVFVLALGPAVHLFAKDHDGRLPGELSDLKPYLNLPVDDSVFARYEIKITGRLADVHRTGFYPPTLPGTRRGRATNPPSDPSTRVPWTDAVIEEKSPVDDQFDTLFTLTLYGYFYRAVGNGLTGGTGVWAKLDAKGLVEIIFPTDQKQTPTDAKRG